MLIDKHGRTIRYLRISVTDRCNQRCLYCLPEKTSAGAPAVSFDQLYRIARVSVGLGIDKVRVTGGEPLVRKGTVDFLRRVAALPGLSDVSLTTNGVYLESRVHDLWAAGLRRLNISLDSLRPDRYARITRRNDFPAVWRGYRAALERGFRPLKINCVVMRGINDDEIGDFAALAARDGVCVRFIEFMPMGEVPWQRDRVVRGAEILERISGAFELVKRSEGSPDDPAREVYQIRGTPGSLGFINTISQPFCDTCSRLRVTAQGTVRPCLLNDLEIDLKPFPSSDDVLAEKICRAVAVKPPRHYVNDPSPPPVRKVMAAVGG
jgi:GTP 3',8-cyclase